MKVRVTKSDIEAGRHNASLICGCPIHHALSRRLRVPGPGKDGNQVLRVRSYYHANLGKIEIPLPAEAHAFQKTLVKDPEAKVKPFTFETELRVKGA